MWLGMRQGIMWPEPAFIYFLSRETGLSDAADASIKLLNEAPSSGEVGDRTICLAKSGERLNRPELDETRVAPRCERQV